MEVDFLEFMYSSPIGEILITYNEEFITDLRFDLEQTQICGPSPILDRCIFELDEYFAGTRSTFDVPIAPAGTAFQQKVWGALCTIPCGEIADYGSIAAAIGQPKAARAVGGANNRNPIYIIVPCHRVIGKSGKMVGYGGGIWRKQWLIAHEQKMMKIYQKGD